jgi:uncharacterized protein YecE (DUF72 family)
VIRVGCSGWNYAHWRNGVFYPPRLGAREWLGFYAQQFDTVELNTTFYRLPRRDVVSRWVEATPEGFVFTAKASRYLTHVKRLADLPEHLDKLLARLEPLVRWPKLGPILWQLPPTFQRDDKRLAAALESLPAALRHAFEFRHESWFEEAVYELLRRHDVALVVADRAGAEALRREVLTASFTYVRFHAGPGEGSYPPEELDAWADRLAKWARSADVYAYFNNDWQGFAIENAHYLNAALGLPATRSDAADRRSAIDPAHRRRHADDVDETEAPE